MFRRTAALLAFATILLSVPATQAQDEPAPTLGPQLPQAQMGSQAADVKTGNPLRDEQLRKMQKRRAADRQKHIQEDTDELLRLATELKQYVDKTNENIMSIQVIRKAEEIEKLAKRVKTSMREPTDGVGIR